MYTLRGHLVQRGFFLDCAGRTVFETSHRFGISKTSSAQIGDDRIVVKVQNLAGNKCAIFKNGEDIGRLDFSHYLKSLITLKQPQGARDQFTLKLDGGGRIYSLSQGRLTLIKFTADLNSWMLSDEYAVECLSEAYPKPVLEALLLYAGEILFRSERPRGY